MSRFITLLALLIISIPLVAYARPVSYPGGWTLMQMNNADMHSFHAHYSPTKDYSIGYKAEYWTEDNFQIHGAQVNYLAKRWNNRASQANMYIKGLLGVAYSDHESFSGETDPAASIGFGADWEDRRYFVSYENRYIEAGNIADFYMQTARVGIAPYIGDYGDLHTWIMLELEHQPESDEEVTVMPMLRFFKDVYLVETGVSHRGDIMANFIVRF